MRIFTCCTLFMMRHLLTIITAVAFMQCSTNEPLTFETKTKGIFFGADLQKDGKELFAFYKESTFLSLAPPPEGYTMYPPLSALGQDRRTDYHTFRFDKHPNLNIPFEKGELIITSSNKDNTKVYSEPVLKFFFATKEDLELGYNQLVEDYNRLSTRKRFSSHKDAKNAEFTDDKAKVIKEVGFMQGRWDELAQGYVLVFGLGNDMDIDKQN
jgi:hypothetical protein